MHPPKQKDRPAKVDAAEKIYREDGEESRIGLPSEMLFASLVNAGRKVKAGKTQISTAKTTTLPDIMSINDSFLPLINIAPEREEEFWRVDKRRGRLQDGTAICVVRPRFDAWEFEVTVEFDRKKVNEGVIRQLFDAAGSGQGLGAFRPNCKGPFGRFEVVGWTVINSSHAEAA